MRKETERYRNHILLWKTSGINKAEYCRRNTISYKAFLYQYKILSNNKKNPGFVELDVEEPLTDGLIEFHYADCNHFIFSKGSSAKFIHQVIFG